MKKIERVLWGMFLVGLLFKVMHWPGAGILTVISLGLVSSLYFYFGVGIFNNIKFKNLFKKGSYSNISKLNIVFGVAFGIILSILVIGFLFKFMLWPGGDLMLISGLILLSVSLIIYLVLSKSNKVSLSKNSFIRILIIGIISLSIYFIQSDTIIDFYYPQDKPYAEALKKIVKNPNDKESQEEFVRVREARQKKFIEEERN